MADVVTTQILENGPRHIVAMFTGIWSTGETGVKKIDAQSTTFANNIQGQQIVPGINLKIVECEYSVGGEQLDVLWDATTPVSALVLGGYGKFDFRRQGGLVVPPGLVGATGSILFTTLNGATGGFYSVLLYLTKGIPQA